ncbi:unnamed protein product [Aphanomyces euteiches]
MTDKDLAKWKRRIEENRYIREHLLDKANLLVYTIQSLSARPRPLGIVDLYTIWRLVGQGYNVNERDDNGIPPLVHCAVRGWLVAIAMLFKSPCDVNVTSIYQETALSAACRRGHLHVVRYLLWHGADTSVRDKVTSFFTRLTKCERQSGFSCLRWAAKNRHVAMVKLLLKRGASDCGTTSPSALDWARDNHDKEIEGLLMSVLIQEKEAQLRGLQAKESDVAPSRPPPPTPPPAIAEATVEPETKQNSRLARLADERRAQQSQLMEEALARQTDMYLKSIRPAHKEETLMQAAVHTEWRKVKPHKWKLVGLPPKRESSTRVDMRRIQQLTALDDLDEETPTTIDAMATFAIKHQPKPARFKYFCPQFE